MARTLREETEDGVRIHAYWLPAPGANRAFVFLHGNAGNASHRLPNAAELQRMGAHVLLMDYRGFGKSEGSPSEKGAYADARSALAHVTGARGVPSYSRVMRFPASGQRPPRSRTARSRTETRGRSCRSSPLLSA